MMNTFEFRRRLESITEDRSPVDYLPMLEDLRREYPHTIVEIDSGADCRVNCFAFALGLHRSGVYWHVCALGWELKVFADPSFIRYLQGRGDLVERAFPDAGESVIVYLDKAVAKHAGVWAGHRVRSKWGTGRCFEHGIWEIPANYGNESNYFDCPQITVVERAFKEYATAQGVDLGGL